MVKQYITILNNLSKLLNHNGRTKKGFNSQKEFIHLLREFKEGYNMDLSSKFLINLMSENENRTHRQKSQRIRDLTRGLKRSIKKRFFKGLEQLKYKTDIKEWAKNKTPLYPHKIELTEADKKPIRKKFNSKFLRDFEIEFYTDEETEILKNLKQQNRNEHNKDGGAFLKNIRTQSIGKEFICVSSETLNFIQI